MEKLLIPENDLQELWELNGRVKAVLAWTESDPYITKKCFDCDAGGSGADGRRGTAADRRTGNIGQWSGLICTERRGRR